MALRPGSPFIILVVRCAHLALVGFAGGELVRLQQPPSQNLLICGRGSVCQDFISVRTRSFHLEHNRRAERAVNLRTRFNYVWIRSRRLASDQQHGDETDREAELSELGLTRECRPAPRLLALHARTGRYR